MPFSTHSDSCSDLENNYDSNRSPMFAKLDEYRSKIRQFEVDLLNYKIYRVTILHWLLLVLWSVLLLKFTSFYREFYQKTSLFATMCTNILLFGCSDILAQGIACFYSSQIDPIPRIINDTSNHIIQQLHDHESGYESDGFSVFNEYGVTPVTSNESIGDSFVSDPMLNGNKTIIFNFWRWGCFMIWGAFISNFQVPWYKILNFFFTSDPSVIQVFERVLCDQLVYSPIFLYFFFTYSNYIMEGGDAETLRFKIQRIYISTLGCNLLVWPLAQIINFSIMPKHLQVPFSSSVGVVWNCFLSMRNASNSL